MKQPVGFIRTYPKLIIQPDVPVLKQRPQQSEMMIILAGPVIGCNHKENEDDD